jgi:hypothetical protein
MSLEEASFWGTVANWALIFCLVGGVVSTFVIVKTTDVKEIHWDDLRTEGTRKTAELALETAKAKENAAAAEERTARLNIAIEDERKKRLPRRLTDEQIAIFERFLEKEKRTFFVVAKHEDEPMQYAQQFIDLFSKHHLLEGAAFKGIYTDGPGLRLYIPIDGFLPHEQAIQDPIAQAFKEANLLANFGWGAPPPNPGFQEKTISKHAPTWKIGHPVIWIGEKPTPRD